MYLYRMLHKNALFEIVISLSFITFQIHHLYVGGYHLFMPQPTRFKPSYRFSWHAIVIYECNVKIYLL